MQYRIRGMLKADTYYNWGLTKPRYVRLREYRPGLYKSRPTPPFLADNPGNEGHVRCELSIDAEGFIEPSRVHEQPDVTIAFLGGSTTAIEYVQPQLRFPYLVGESMST